MKRTLTLLLCTAMLLTMMPIVFAASDYWGFDDYDVFENPETDELTSYPTTVKRVENAKYSFVSELDCGTMTITFKEMAWGTYNLWEWNLKDTSGNTHTFLPGGTDLEYVYRTSKSASGPMYFTGGNHGNEALVSLEFYNGETGEKIELTTGESVKVNVLHIIEKTNLLYFPDVNPADSIGDYINKNQTYTESDIFANVTRKYTITGPQVRLNVDYKYTTDIYHGVSYTCMFPIAKKYGLYADMIDKDGNLVKTVVTADVGKADYSGPMNSGNKATRALLYGKNYSQYQFDVHINTYEDSLESQKNSFLTAFWDMNTTQNKLYFSKCDSTSLVKYEKGKEVHTECVWRFVYDEAGRTPTETPDKPIEDGPQDNLASGRDYIISVTNDDPGAPEYNTYYAADLTDGVAATEFNASNNSWFAFSGYKPNIVNGVGTVTIDLGGSYEITKLRAHLFNNISGMGVKPPKSVSAYAIVGGEEVKLCDLGEITSEDAVAYWISGESEGIVTDKVIFKFTLDGMFMYLNEVEIHGEKASAPIDPPSDAILGDVNNDGNINQYDYILVKRHYFETRLLTDDEITRADVNKDGKINQYDYILIKRHYFGTYVIG